MARLLALLSIVAATALAACGGDDENTGGGAESASTGAQETTTLKVGVIPIADVAPLYLGMEKGFFEAENLEIEPQLAQGGAAIVPAVMSGDNQIGFSNVMSLMLARAKGLPVKIIAPANEEAAEEDQAFTRLLVKRDGDIRDLADLDGRTVAVNTLQNINEIGLMAAFERQGLEDVNVEYVEVPIPDMPAAVEAGRVDAAVASEPFVTLNEDVLRPVASPYWAIAPSATVAAYFTSEQFLDENPDVVERFRRAMTRSLEYASQHEDEVRAILPSYAKIDQETADDVDLPGWSGELNRESMQRVADLGVEAGFLEESPNLDELIAVDGGP
jgi:NitT/TauT family transport system substrate-binding protein